MKRLVPAVAVLAAAGILGAVGWSVLAGGPREAPAPPPPDRKAPLPPPPRSAPSFPPTVTVPSQAPAPAPAGEPPLPPDAYPWEVPGWWTEIDSKFREKEMTVEGETLTVARILEKVSAEVGFPVRVGPELAKWAGETSLSLAWVRAPARSVVENVAKWTNLDMVLGAEALVLHRRGKAPEDRLAQAGRVQWALREADERRSGLREEDPATAALLAMRLEFPLDGVPLREAVRQLGEKLAVPVYTDAAMWRVNPVVRIEAGERTLGDALERMTRPWDAAFDVAARRIVIFRPTRRRRRCPRRN